MKSRFLSYLIAFAALSAVPSLADETDPLAASFARPPDAARPWVYWFPLDGNLTREGITADLEAMARAGIGGFTYMETAQGTPTGPTALAGTLPARLPGGQAARPDRPDEQRRRLVRQRRAVDYSGSVDAEGGLERDRGGGTEALRRRLETSGVLRWVLRDALRVWRAHGEGCQCGISQP